MFAGVTVCHELSFLRKTLLLAVCVVGTWFPWLEAAAPISLGVRVISADNALLFTFLVFGTAPMLEGVTLITLLSFGVIVVPLP